MKILVVEDDRSLSDGICLALGGEGNTFVQCFEKKSAEKAFREQRFDLVILDLNLPDGNGYDFLKELRKTSQVPVLVLTANDMEMNEVAGFQLGADDFMAKPFSIAVLRARIGNIVKRRGAGEEYVLGKLRFSFGEMKFFRDEEEIVLSRTEQKLLKLLVENKNRTLPRELLMDRLWSGGGEFVDENALSVAVSRLRNKLEEDPSHPVHIRTVYGVGYVWKEEGL